MYILNKVLFLQISKYKYLFGRENLETLLHILISKEKKKTIIDTDIINNIMIIRTMRRESIVTHSY